MARKVDLLEPEITEGEQRQLVPESQPPHPLALMDKLISSPHSAEELRTLFELQREWQKDRAREAYNAAMNATQAAMPLIVCDSHNPQTNSKYPSLENINRNAHPVYTKHGLSVSFGEGETRLEGHCRTTMEIRHIDGHAEQFFLDLPLDGIGIKGNANMTKIHGKLSSDTYARTRLMVKGFNLTIADDGTDNDGNDVATFATEDQVQTLQEWIEQAYTSADAVKRFLEWLKQTCGAESISKIPAKDYQRVFDAVKKVADGKRK